MFLKKKNIDMTEGVIWQRLTAYAIPLLIGELFQLFYTMVDSITVGNFVGADALAAIGASETIVKVLVGFFNGMEVGFTVVIARCFGARDRRKLDEAVNGVLQLGALMGFVITVLGLFLTRPILRLIDTPEAILTDASAYLSIYFMGILGFVLYNTAASALKAVGDVRTPLYCLLISSAVNIVLDLLLVIVFHLGVEGVAAATIAAQWLAAIIALRAMTRRKQIFTVDIRHYRLTAPNAWQFFRMGVPTGFQKTITSISNVLVLSRITYFGGACLAGWTVYNKIDHLLTVVIQSMGASLSTFVSQNLGARKYHRIRQGVRTTLLGGTAVFLPLAACLVLARGPLVRLFGADADMRYYAEHFVLYVTFFKLTQLLMNVYSGTLRGAGRMTLVTVIMLSGIVAFRQVYLLFIAAVANIPWLVGLSYPAGWTFSGGILCLMFHLSVQKEWRNDPEWREL